MEIFTCQMFRKLLFLMVVQSRIRSTMFPCLLEDAVPALEVEKLRLTAWQLECRAGCSLLSPPLSSLICVRLVSC